MASKSVHVAYSSYYKHPINKGTPISNTRQSQTCFTFPSKSSPPSSTRRKLSPAGDQSPLLRTPETGSL